MEPQVEAVEFAFTYRGKTYTNRMTIGTLEGTRTEIEAQINDATDFLRVSCGNMMKQLALPAEEELTDVQNVG